MRILLILFSMVLLFPAQPTAQPARTKLLIAFSSFRERRQHPQVYFYEHDGIDQGKIVGTITPVNQRSDYHPTLSHDGRLCAFASERENQVGKLQLWDIKEKKEIALPKINDSPNALMHAALSGDGKLLACSSWNRPGSTPRWDIGMYDRDAGKFAEMPNLNTAFFDERMPAFNRDGSLLAFVTNSKDGAGLNDVMLYDRKAGKVLKMPELNSPNMDIEPSLSADGRLIAFVSDRPGGQRGRDIYLFDREKSKFIPLAGLNSAAHEQTPALSTDGRYLVFVSERISGEGERDVFLYDRQAGKLLPTPGLNSSKEDFDPSIVVVQP